MCMGLDKGVHIKKIKLFCTFANQAKKVILGSNRSQLEVMLV